MQRWTSTAGLTTWIRLFPTKDLSTLVIFLKSQDCLLSQVRPQKMAHSVSLSWCLDRGLFCTLSLRTRSVKLAMRKCFRSNWRSPSSRTCTSTLTLTLNSSSRTAVFSRLKRKKQLQSSVASTTSLTATNQSQNYLKRSCQFQVPSLLSGACSKTRLLLSALITPTPKACLEASAQFNWCLTWTTSS